MLDALLLELEGVVVDTREARCAALVGSLAADGVAIGAADYDELASGLTPRQGVAAILASEEIPSDEIRADLIALRAERAFVARIGKGAALQGGVLELLRDAQSRTRLAVVTRASRAVADLVLSLVAPDLVFETVVTADDVVDPKPSPDGYRIALERLGRRRTLSPGNCIALEDSLVGIQAARACGLRSIAVGELPAHRALEADGWIRDLRDATVPSLVALATGNASARSADRDTRSKP